MFHSVQSQVTVFSMVGNFAEIETAKEGCHYLSVTSVSVTTSAIIFNSYENQVSFKLAAFNSIMDIMKLKEYIKENLKLAAKSGAGVGSPTVVNSDGELILDIAAAESLFKSISTNRIL